MFIPFFMLFIGVLTFQWAQAQNKNSEPDFPVPESENFEAKILVVSWNLECSMQTDLVLNLNGTILKKKEEFEI